MTIENTIGRMGGSTAGQIAVRGNDGAIRAGSASTSGEGRPSPDWRRAERASPVSPSPMSVL
ncbi:hypothetical protein ACGFLS_20260 [Streptomyces abikoensis]|uniref:hypothetical protein n=1 Tax=Streptomyces abikoensis TaxID=97398 RepID=UPI00371CE50A